MLTTLVALAERNRLEIVELLREGPLSVNEIAQTLDLRQPQASKHLRVLTEAGLLARESRAQLRIYSLREEPFAEIEGWASSFKGLWEDRLDTLEEYLRGARRKPGPKGDG